MSSREARGSAAWTPCEAYAAPRIRLVAMIIASMMTLR